MQRNRGRQLGRYILPIGLLKGKLKLAAFVSIIPIFSNMSWSCQIFMPEDSNNKGSFGFLWDHDKVDANAF